MAGRYSDILRAAEQKKALDNYVDYLQNIDNKQTKKLVGGEVGAQKVRQSVVVRPFGADKGSASGFLVTVGKTSLEQYGGSFQQRTLKGEEPIANSRLVKGFRPARTRIFEPDNSGGSGRKWVKSKVTKLYYLKYFGTNYSVPFGATSDNEEESVAAADVKAAVKKKLANLDYARVSITAEKVPV